MVAVFFPSMNTVMVPRLEPLVYINLNPEPFMVIVASSLIVLESWV